MKNFIQHNYWFNMNSKHGFKYYVPQNQKNVTNIDQITPQTRKIKFFAKFNEPFNLSSFDKISSIEFARGNTFDKTLNTTNLPPNLTHLKLSNSYTWQSLGDLPPHLVSLTLGDNHYGSIRNYPPKLTYLQYGYWWSGSVENLPRNLTHLVFGSQFSGNVDNILPPKLIYLAFGSEFRSPIKQLPSSIIHLKFGKNWNNSVANLPLYTTHLTLGFCFAHTLEELTPNVTHLFLDNPKSRFQTVMQTLPASITYFTFNYKYIYLSKHKAQ
eukprot:TRINITY_DN5810_c0_g1_i4.p1 TRINITY_DN5810_c0_g1~~TRINITY_DN5810_c0_g1_i4.p1  ORF type:complete len:269 (+),score=33.24 TRINITY_DN5810_c0_g1_i4:1147-1953(+)